MWSQETAFALTEHDENGRQTPLIKDWKDMTTAISDMMALLGSLKESPFFRCQLPLPLDLHANCGLGSSE